MQCPSCKRLRHAGDCEPVYDEPDELELLKMDAEQSVERYHEALMKKTKEPHDGRT